MRLINADNLDCTNLPKKLYPHMQAILDFIDSQTTVEERKVGKWILIDEESNTWQCSHCIELGKDDWWQLNSGTPQDNKMDYCPHCGADMRGTENE